VVLVTKLELAREIAARSVARFVEIEPCKRVTRFTAHKNLMRRNAEAMAARVTELLKAEHRRLVRAWGESRG
jgi:hypothetical protein